MHHSIHPDASTDRGNTTTEPRAAAYATVGNLLMRMNRPLPRRLLGVWAHPDDEAYLSAGLMARVIDAGGTVTVLAATRGEKGTDDPSEYDSDDFGAHREAELRASLATLGVHDVRFMGLRDGECNLADDEQQIEVIATTIRETEPDAVVTFGPDGITHHADHRAISRWTTEGWRRERRGELYYAAMTHDDVASIVSSMSDSVSSPRSRAAGPCRSAGRRSGSNAPSTTPSSTGSAARSQPTPVRPPVSRR